jgi:hypothetical protein
MATLTVGDLTPRLQYTASAGQTAFTYNFPIFQDSDLKVYVGSTLQTLTTNYTVSGAGTSTGGTVTFTSGRSAGDIVTIYRDMPVQRTTDYQANGDLLAENLNDDLDKLTMMVQQNEYNLGLTLRADQFDETTNLTIPNKATRATKALGFDSTGEPVVTNSTIAQIDGTIATVNTLATAVPGSAAAVAYIDDGASAVATTVENKLRESVSVIDYGADPTGAADSTTSIQTALNENAQVYVPYGTYRIDGMITLAGGKSLNLNGTLIRKAAHSASTSPVVQIRGNYNAIIGSGPGVSVIQSENDSPNGVLLYGVEDPTSDYNASRWQNVTDLRIVGNTTLNSSNKVLCLQSSQPYIGGALYAGVFSNLHLFNGYYLIYLGPIANANNFDNIWGYRCNGYTMWCDGSASLGLVTDLNVSNVGNVGNSGSQIASFGGRYMNNCSFSNCGGEPGGGVHTDFDSTCSSIDFSGWNNHSSPGGFTESGTKISQSTVNAFNINCKQLTSYLSSGGVGSFKFGTAGTSFNGKTIDHAATGYSGTVEGLTLRYNATPGSGTKNVYTWFQSNSGGAGLTKHNVVVDGLIIAGAGIVPKTDNTDSLGNASKRWSEVFAATGTINTSDETQKEQISDLSETEKAVAVDLKSAIKKFKWKDSVVKKGDDARIHVGVIAQEVAAIFENHGLNADDYGIFCRDEIYTYNGKVVEVNKSKKYVEYLFLKDGEEVFSEDGQTPEGAQLAKREYDTEMKEVYGIRYDQLMCFVISAL